MRIVAIGNKVFVTAFKLAGIHGEIVENPDQVLDKIKELLNESVGLILISDDMANPVSEQLTMMRSKKSILMYSLPYIGNKKINTDYRSMLKKILGV